jgi:hypothetical protein
MPRTRESNVITDPRARVFADWVENTGRKVGWVAKELGRSKVWISYVLNGHYPISDTLAEDIERRFGLDMGLRRSSEMTLPTPRPEDEEENDRIESTATVNF